MKRKWFSHRWLLIGVVWHCRLSQLFAAGRIELSAERPLVTLSPQIEEIEAAPLPEQSPQLASQEPSFSPAETAPARLMFPAARQLFRSIHFPTSTKTTAAQSSSGVVKASHPEILPTPENGSLPPPPHELIPPPPVSQPAEFSCAPADPCIEPIVPKSQRRSPAIRFPHVRALFGG